jgi:branched-chain amino acid transport system ATP-binding protein
MPTMLLELHNIFAGYGKVEVLRSLSMHVNSEEKVGLFGPNGHGKTTLLRTISGLIKPQNGDIVFQGKSIIRLSPQQIVDHGIIHIPQGNILFPRMTVVENLTLGAYSKRSWDKRSENLQKVFDLFPRLGERKNQLALTLSGGERQMLSIGVGLMGMPSLLLLDEPSLGLAPKIKDELAQTIAEIAQSGVAMIIVDQDIELLLSLCGRLYLIEKGRVSLETHDNKSIQQNEILDMYFGNAARWRSI